MRKGGRYKRVKHNKEPRLPPTHGPGHGDAPECSHKRSVALHCACGARGAIGLVCAIRTGGWLTGGTAAERVSRSRPSSAPSASRGVQGARAPGEGRAAPVPLGYRSDAARPRVSRAQPRDALAAAADFHVRGRVDAPALLARRAYHVVGPTGRLRAPEMSRTRSCWRLPCAQRWSWAWCWRSSCRP